MAQNVVNIANGLKPDLIALTGDFVDGTIVELAEDIAPISQFQSPQGSFYITGNHEYYWGAEAWIEHFKILGLNVLANEHRLIKKDGAAIVLAGVNDYSTLRMGTDEACNPQKSIDGAPSGLVKILLAHQPVTYDMAEKAGFDLQLSGHTHAGQYFPFSLLIRFFQKYYKGLNRYKNMQIYVNIATGYWGPPLRTGVPTEITLITLRPE
jgi:predicted MPP superfamily phosphohydrolase